MSSQDSALGKPCAGNCGKKIHGISFKCPRCGEHYCFLCSYNNRWKCPKCGTELT